MCFWRHQWRNSPCAEPGNGSGGGGGRRRSASATSNAGACSEDGKASQAVYATLVVNGDSMNDKDGRGTLATIYLFK